MCDNLIIVATAVGLQELRDLNNRTNKAPFDYFSDEKEAIAFAEAASTPGDTAYVLRVVKKFTIPQPKGEWVTVAKGMGNGHSGGDE